MLTLFFFYFKFIKFKKHINQNKRQFFFVLDSFFKKSKFFLFKNKTQIYQASSVLEKLFQIKKKKPLYFVQMNINSEIIFRIPYYLMNLVFISALLSLTLIKYCNSEGASLGSIPLPASSTFTKSKDNNVLYIATIDYKIYRLNYTRYVNNIVPVFLYKTSHTNEIRTMAVSQGEVYLATGSEDGSIEVSRPYTQTVLCKFTTLNQLRSIVFHPKYDQIFYAGSVDDVIRKYNITNCSNIGELAVGGSIHVMGINQDGAYIAYGTYEGNVGKVDQNLTSFTLASKQHLLTVMYLFMLYKDFYLTIGDDNAVVLWNSGNFVARINSLSNKRLGYCGIFNQFEQYYNFRAFGCYEKDGTTITGVASNTTVRRFVFHQTISSSPSWVDYRRLSSDEQIWVYHNGNNLLSYKVYEQPSTLCNSNNKHLWVQINKNVCRFCGYMFDGCHFCGDFACSSCIVGKYMNNAGDCVQCPKGCADCSSNTSCSICSTGYQLDSRSSLCVQTSNQPGCFQITWQGNNGNGIGGSYTCAIPGNGYYTSSGSCLPCSNTMVGCMECSSSIVCLTCRTGYYINTYKSCTPCSTTMPGCLACTNSTVCLKCQVAYKYVGSNLQCSDCHPTCKTCLYFYNDCSSCYDAQNRILTGTQCNCKSTYFDNSSSNSYTCPLCSSVLNQCYLCNNQSVCTQCNTYYYPVTSGGKTQCQACSKYCQTCVGVSTYCTTCNELTHFRVINNSTNTCQCMSGYVSVGNSVPCLPCEDINPGCITCTNATNCVSCQSQYYLKVTLLSRLCEPCPYYCSDCSLSGAGTVKCNSCPPNTFRTLTNDSCPCDTGYFDDNRTLICQKCSDVLSDCLTCQNRTKCTGCAPGMFMDSSRSFCALCNPTCLTCAGYYDICATCDPASNRVINGNKCVCLQSTYEQDGVCKLCNTVISNCISCENPYICTGCDTGYTLQQDFKMCIDCKGSINGCDTCKSVKNCTSCLVPFILVNQRCRCPNSQYTSKNNWGKCKDYGIPGMKSRLGVQLQAHQHQNNTLIVFIRFRAQTLYVLNKKINQSIKLTVNNLSVPFNFDFIQNNRIKISTELNSSLEKPNVSVVFSKDVFYNQDLQTLSDLTETVTPTRLYKYLQQDIKTQQSIRQILRYIFYILKWVFFVFCIIGQVHLIFPFVVFIQLMPVFLMLNMSLPASLSMVLDAMLSFQVKSIVPLLGNSDSKFIVLFPPITYDYYNLHDFILLCKIGDFLLIVLVNVMTKFDEGIVRMFPPGKIRRYLYQSLVRRGYAAMSLCILAFQPSLIILSGVYLPYTQPENSTEVFNYCCCAFIFGFYLVYNFNHASNLQGGKLMKNIQNQACFFDINSQEPAAPKTTLIVLVTDFWLVGAIHLMPTMIYFIISIMLLTTRLIMHLRRDFYVGRIQFAIRTFSNLFLLSIFCLMFVYYLGEKIIYIDLETAQKMGISTTALILAYIFFHIVEKVLYMLKLQASFLETKVQQLQTGEKILVINGNDVQNLTPSQKEEKQQNQDVYSHKSHNVQQFFSRTAKDLDNGFSGLNFRKKKQQSHGRRSSDAFQSKSITETNSVFLQSPFGESGKIGTSLANKTHEFFKNSKNEGKSKQKDMYSPIKSSNTSKYAKNHLQLRYRAQQVLTKNNQ